MLGDVVLNPSIPDIFRKCRLPQSFFSGTDEGGSVVISKQERFNCKVSIVSISGLVELLELEIELVVGSNASLDDIPDKTTSSQVARVKGPVFSKAMSVAFWWFLLPLHHLCGFLACYSVIYVSWMLTAGLLII